MKFFGIEESEKVCANCMSYIQHHTRKRNRDYYDFTAINMGHCTYPRNKTRKPGEEACKYFESRNYY